MTKYRMKQGATRDVVFDAYRLPEAGEDVPDSFFDWCDEVGFWHWVSGEGEGLDILGADQPDDITVAHPGDWIIKGVDGVFRPMPHGDFVLAIVEATDAKEAA